MKRLICKVLYWLSETAFEIHEILFDLASREVVEARASAYRYRSVCYTQESLGVASAHVHDLTGAGWQCRVILKREYEALRELDLELAKKNKETEAT